MQTHYGHYVRILHWCTDQAMTAALAEMDLTAAQGHVLGFLTHRREPACSRDVEEAFRLSHPTVSGILSRLEKKGFLEFRPDDHDRRCKRIHILPKGRECLDVMHRTIERTEEGLVRDFSEEEREIFTDLLQRAIHNMGASPCKRKHKEESET